MVRSPWQIAANELSQLRGSGGVPFTEFVDALLRAETKHPLRRACKRAGLRQIGWHVLRHTFASHLVMRKAPIKAVQELMGHSTIVMTERYAHLSPDVRKDAVRLLDRPVPQADAHVAHTNGGDAAK